MFIVNILVYLSKQLKQRVMEYIWRYYEFEPLKGHKSLVSQVCDSEGNYPEIRVNIEVYASTHEESINKAKEIAKQLNYGN